MQSFSPTGKKRWTALAGTNWNTIFSAYQKASDYSSNYVSKQRRFFVPSLTSLSLYSPCRNGSCWHNSRRAIRHSLFVVIGETRIAVFDIDGDAVWSDTLPTHSFSISEAFPMDYNADGVTDIVLFTTNGVIAYKGSTKASAIVFQVLLGGLLVSMIAIYISQQRHLFNSVTNKNSKYGRKKRKI